MSYEGNCRLGDLFSSRREKGREGLPTLSVTLNNGVVNRDDLDRKQDTTLSANEHLLVKPGDIAYNMMRMWQGASGMVDKEGLVSPAYVVLKPKPAVDPAFASYLFKTKRMTYLFWAYSYGLTDDRLRLYARDFASIPVNVPAAEEQRKIATIIAKWDLAIAVCERLIENSKSQKRALMQRLLPKSRSGQSTPNGWAMVHLDELVTVNPGKASRPPDGRVSFLPMEAVTEDGQIRRLLERSYESVCSGYTAFIDGDVLVAKITPCFENGKGALVSCLLNGIGFGSTEFHVLRVKSNVSANLIAHIVSSHEFRTRGASEMTGSAGQKRVPADYIRSFNIAIPTEAQEQGRIVSMLDAAERARQVLTIQMKILQQQKSSLMQQLLTGKRRVQVDQSPQAAA